MQRLLTNYNYLVTLRNEIISPNGQQYKAVYGEVTSNNYTNRNNLSSVTIGSTTIPIEDISHCIQTDVCVDRPSKGFAFGESGQVTRYDGPRLIFFADEYAED